MRRTLALIALPAYAVLLATATHYPRVRIPGEIPQSDKLLHFTAFGLLALLWWRFYAALRPIGARFAWASGLGLVAYAGLDEYLQQFVGRFTDVADFAANAAGILAVLAVLELRRRLAQGRSDRLRSK